MSNVLTIGNEESGARRFEFWIKRSPAKPSLVWDSYWRFAAERQNVFFARIEGKDWPLTDDPILRTYRFTNVYRASDRVSQYLIRHVIYGNDNQSPEDLFFRRGQRP